MTEFQAQAWICPVCFDDHGGRDCKVDDLKAEIANLRAEAERREGMFRRCLESENRAQADLAAAESALASIRTLARSWSGRHDLLMTGDSAAHDIEAALAANTTTERSEG